MQAQHHSSHSVAEPCGARVVRKESRAPCIANVSFGCSQDDHEKIWIDAGCRGVFRMEHGEHFSCGTAGAPRRRYSCRAEDSAGRVAPLRIDLNGTRILRRRLSIVDGCASATHNQRPGQMAGANGTSTNSSHQGCSLEPREPRPRPSSVKVAVLYSGRWFWPQMWPWVDNHMRTLVEPNDADVVLLSSLDTWCSPAASGTVAGLWAEVQQAFGRHAVASAVVDDPPPHTIRGTMGSMRAAAERAAPEWDPATVSQHCNSAYKATMMYNWRKQLSKAALLADLLRLVEQQHGRYDLIVKTRIDVSFSAVLPVRLLHPIDATWVHSAAHMTARRSAWAGDILWRDWLYVSGGAGLAAMAEMAIDRLLFNTSARCFGFCQEEQTWLQLEARHLTLHPLPNPPWGMVLRKAADLQRSRYVEALRERTNRNASLVRLLGLRDGCEDAAVQSSG